MSAILAAGTKQGVVIFEQAGDGWRPVWRALEKLPVTSVSARQGRLLAGTRQGIYRSDDYGHTWVQVNAGLAIPLVRWLEFHPEVPGFIFVGTEPAGIFVSHNGGDSWRISPEVAELRDRLGWYLPYSPLSGCVRCFTFNGERGYAAVEVGGVLVSNDSGDSWQLVSGSSGNPAEEGAAQSGLIHADVHSVSVHSSSRDLISAATGGGFYRSKDGGWVWQLLYDCYCRAAWVDPVDPDHIILGPADGVDQNGRIEESRDGGATWSVASSGLAVPWRDHMVERFFQVDHHLFAILSNGKVVVSEVDNFVWKQAFTELQGVSSLAVIQ